MRFFSTIMPDVEKFFGVPLAFISNKFILNLRFDLAKRCMRKVLNRVSPMKFYKEKIFRLRENLHE